MKHLCFIDDDPDEITTFKRLFDGAVFTITSILAQDAANAIGQMDRSLKGAIPDLFVLDLYFPLSSDSPQGFDQLSQSDMTTATQEIADIHSAVKELEATLKATPEEGKKLLREAHAVLHRSRKLLDDWCEQLNQSPAGGIQLIKQLDAQFPKVPKVFYSRKATLQNAKEALAAGALDVLAKPDQSLENTQKTELARHFLAYCNHEMPSYLSKWITKIRGVIGINRTGPYAEVSVEKDL